MADIGHITGGFGKYDENRRAISVNASINSDNVLALINDTLDLDQKAEFGGEGGADIYYGWDALQEARVDKHKNWLKSYSKWENKLGKGWSPKKFLGGGGYGLAGLFEYTSFEGDDDNVFDKKVRHVVVKQAIEAPGPQFGLKAEGDWFKLLNSTKSVHFPRLYAGPFRDIGAGSPALIADHRREEVHRLIMEYCEGGDMGTRIVELSNTWAEARLNKPGAFAPEVEVWSVLVCLAKAAVVLERGSEDPNAEKWPSSSNKGALMHCDLKPGNIFVGAQDNSPEHSFAPVHKIGDYGLMIHLKDDAPAGMTGTWPIENNITERGTRQFLGPEQMVITVHGDEIWPDVDPELPTEQRLFDNALNVWGVGTCIWCLMTISLAFKSIGPLVRCPSDPALNVGPTVTRELATGFIHDNPRYQATNRSWIMDRSDESGEIVTKFKMPYSKSLRILVMRCLMQRPAHRITAKELLEQAEQGLKLAREQTNLDTSFIADLPAAQSPPEPPANWLKWTEPADYWAPAPEGLPAKLLPLRSVVRAKVHEMKRFLQVWDARIYEHYEPSSDELSRIKRVRKELKDTQKFWDDYAKKTGTKHYFDDKEDKKVDKGATPIKKRTPSRKRARSTSLFEDQPPSPKMRSGNFAKIPWRDVPLLGGKVVALLHVRGHGWSARWYYHTIICSPDTTIAQLKTQLFREKRPWDVEYMVMSENPRWKQGVARDWDDDKKLKDCDLPEKQRGEQFWRKSLTVNFITRPTGELDLSVDADEKFFEEMQARRRKRDDDDPKDRHKDKRTKRPGPQRERNADGAQDRGQGRGQGEDEIKAAQAEEEINTATEDPEMDFKSYPQEPQTEPETENRQ